MSNKQTIQYYKELAAGRGHNLISVSNPNTPSKGNLELKCTVCAKEFTTSAISSKNAKASGCPECKSIKARAQKGPPRQPLTDEKKAARNAKIRATRLERKLKAVQYDNISSRADLVQLLETQNNAYSSFIIEKLNDNSSNIVGGEIHHIIPKHAGGPDSKWNLIKLSKVDHVEAHKLRYLAFGEFGDYNFLKTVRVDIPIHHDFQGRIRNNATRGTDTQQKTKVGIFAPGVSAEGGRASAARSSRQRDLSHQVQMGDAVHKALYGGSNWSHKTGATLELGPGEVILLGQLKNRFIEALPEGNKYRVMLETAKRNVDVTSSIGKVIKGERKSAYGWALIQPKVDSDLEIVD